MELLPRSKLTHALTLAGMWSKGQIRRLVQNFYWAFVKTLCKNAYAGQARGGSGEDVGAAPLHCRSAATPAFSLLPPHPLVQVDCAVGVSGDSFEVSKRSKTPPPFPSMLRGMRFSPPPCPPHLCHLPLLLSPLSWGSFKAAPHHAS